MKNNGNKNQMKNMLQKYVHLCMYAIYSTYMAFTPISYVIWGHGFEHVLPDN